MTQNTPGLVEYLSGDPNNPGYRADHGGGNYHDHLGFKDKATTLKAKKALEAAGIRVTGLGDQTGHAPNSRHKYWEALDVPGGQWGKGTDKEVFAGSQKVRRIMLDTFGGGQGKPAPAAGSAPQPAEAEAGYGGDAATLPTPMAPMAPPPLMQPLALPSAAVQAPPAMASYATANGLGGSQTVVDSRPTLTEMMGLGRRKRDEQAMSDRQSSLAQLQQLLLS
jgi:hypothetical protein